MRSTKLMNLSAMITQQKEKADTPLTLRTRLIATIKFEQGVTAQWTWVGSAPGHGFRQHTVYGSEGSLDWNQGLVPRSGETNLQR